MKEFSCSTVIHIGRGSGKALAELGAKRLFMVADPYFVRSGDAARIVAGAKAEFVEVFDQIQPDPSVDLVAQGTARLKDFNPDLLVALGGGSTMDCAKAMAYFSGTKARLVAIPTTSGSGSEVTDFAILTHNGIKHPLVDPKLRPDMAILDADLLTQMPESLVADGGFDVLTHALEAYAATESSSITDALAREAFCNVYENLPDSFAGDLQCRLDIHQAATMAAMAFNQAGLGLCHGMAHALGGLFHLPHGRLNAILLPAVMECNLPGAKDKYARLAREAGLGTASDTLSVRNLKNGLLRLRRDLKLPGTLVQSGVPAAEVWEKQSIIQEAVLADPCCATNPVPVNEELVRQVLETVTGHG